ncbi:YcaO-like family protein [Paracoccus kondratievae]|uniref:YcaO domain-containing protein n=1 Tax=Paracoccus kondratievae TaxID=135740 RepID=A0AAD3NYX9_9RHOB|nr:YcaO-like family protein [Paracoccus kondratievae]GLK64343.1 hypothetical protein GCM10017635_18140 [Paracoccus kondratievae]
MTLASPCLMALRAETEKQHRRGTHRTVPPAQTLARLTALMPAIGITRLANLTGLDRIGLPVTMACRPNARSLVVAQGKGLDLAAAGASALMEAAELYHAEHIEQPLKLGGQAELAPTHDFADLARLPRISDRFHPDLVMLWIEGNELVSGSSRWVPFEMVRANYTLPPPPGSGCFECSSNGLGAGNSMGEALCHAICELIERDATTLWNARPDRRADTGLDPDSIDDPACREVLAQLQRAGFGITLWETTSDIGVPSFFCLLTDRRDPLHHHGIGAGTHPSPGIALMRALTEAVQVRMTYISGARDDLSPAEFTARHRAERAAEADALRAAHHPRRDFAAIADQAQDSFAGDLEWLLERLQATGMNEVVAVDLSRPQLGLPVVRVVIPGLEGPDDHAAYRPGRRALAMEQAQ